MDGWASHSGALSHHHLEGLPFGIEPRIAHSGTLVSWLASGKISTVADGPAGEHRDLLSPPRPTCMQKFVGRTISPVLTCLECPRAAGITTYVIVSR